MKYSSTKYLWPEKNLDKIIEKKNIENDNKFSFDENEFKNLVSPLILNLIEKNLNENQIYLKSIKNEKKKTISNVPIWVPITISVLSTSLFFSILIIFLILTSFKK